MYSPVCELVTLITSHPINRSAKAVMKLQDDELAIGFNRSVLCLIVFDRSEKLKSEVFCLNFAHLISMVNVFDEIS
jgi:hypothetical protein